MHQFSLLKVLYLIDSSFFSIVKGFQATVISGTIIVFFARSGWLVTEFIKKIGSRRQHDPFFPYPIKDKHTEKVYNHAR